MKTKEDFKALYDEARRSGVAHTQKELAAISDVAETTVSKALNGVPGLMNDELYNRISFGILRAKGINADTINIDTAGNNIQKNFDNVSNPDVKDIVSTLVSEMAAQRQQLMEEMAAQRKDFMELLRQK